MPPKKGKKGKGAAPAADLDQMSPEEMNEKQLKKYVATLREDVNRERKERIYFQLDTDKLRSFLDICRRDLEETRVRLSHLDGKSKEANKRQRFESGRYEVKVKHSECEQHNTLTEKKMDVSATNSLSRSQHAKAELALRNLIQSVREEQRYENHMKENSIREVKMKQRMEMRELTKDYDGRFREMGDDFCKKYQLKVYTEEKRHCDHVKRLEEKWKNHTKELTKKHKTTLRAAGEKLSVAQTEAVVKEKALEKRAGDLQKQLTQTVKDLNEAQQENAYLSESVRKAEQTLADFQQQIYDFHQSRGNVEKNKTRMKLAVSELRDVTVKHELLHHAFEKLEEEHSETLKKHRADLWDLQQRGALKEQMLQRRLTFLTQSA